MSVTEIDLDTFPRKEHVRYFSALAYPYVGVTQNIDLTAFLPRIRQRGYPFFLTFLWCVSAAANAVPELRQRLSNGKLLQYDFCCTSHTVARPDGTYCYCTLDCGKEFDTFLPYAERMQTAALETGSIEESAEEAQSLIFVSCMPWMSFTALVQPVPYPPDSNPRITWGRFTTENGRTQMPVSLLCNHALVDGRHLAEFYAQLERQLLRFGTQSGLI